MLLCLFIHPVIAPGAESSRQANGRQIARTSDQRPRGTLKERESHLRTCRRGSPQLSVAAVPPEGCLSSIPPAAHWGQLWRHRALPHTGLGTGCDGHWVLRGWTGCDFSNDGETEAGRAVEVAGVWALSWEALLLFSARRVIAGAEPGWKQRWPQPEQIAGPPARLGKCPPCWAALAAAPRRGTGPGCP